MFHWLKAKNKKNKLAEKRTKSGSCFLLFLFSFFFFLLFVFSAGLCWSTSNWRCSNRCRNNRALLYCLVNIDALQCSNECFQACIFCLDACSFNNLLYTCLINGFARLMQE